MARKAKEGNLFTSLGSLGWPVFLGGWATGAYFLLLLRGPLHSEFLIRYTASHPINMTEVALFFVGMAALICKLVTLLGEMKSSTLIELPEPVDGLSTEETCQELLEKLDQLPARAQTTYLGKRLRSVVQTVSRRGLADGIDEDLRYHADLDIGRQQDSYGLVRIAIWAIPMLGFLGTVVGITMALGDFANQLGVGEAGGDLNSSMKGLLAGLYVAFDTTALALALAMFMMFLQFTLERMESQLLSSVDDRAATELAGRFEQLGAARDPVVASVTRMSASLVRSIESLGERQAEVWRSTVEETGRLFSDSLANTLDHSLQTFAHSLGKQEENALGQLQNRLGHWQAALEQNASLLAAQQQEILRQSELLAQVANATGDVAKLETVLNRNLETLAGSKNFEDTVMSLAAAIQLLSTRLKQTSGASIELPSARKSRDKAA